MSGGSAPAVLRRRRLLLALVLLVCTALRLALAPDPVGHHAIDGSFYVHVARHVAAGDGLMTRVSLYHQGLAELPHWSAIYPLWPLALGGAARLAGMDVAARALPPLVATAALLLLYALADRTAACLRRGRANLGAAAAAVVADAATGDAGVPADASVRANAGAPADASVRADAGAPADAGVRADAGDAGAWTAGHLAVLVLGLNPVFLVHTALPYADGLGFALAFAALVAVDRARVGPSLVWAAWAGALAGLAYLARAQLFAVAIAVPAALALAAPRRPRFAAAAVAAALGVGVTVGPWVAWLASRASPFAPAMLLDFTSYRETPELAPFALTVATDSLGAWLRDRAAGLAVAFSPRHPLSYFASFGAAVLLLPLAAVVAAVDLARRVPPSAVATGASPRWVLPLALAITGLGSIAGVHALHATYIWPWWFHWRHGLPLALPITWAIAWTWARGGRSARLAAAGLVAIAALQGGLATARLAGEPRYAPLGPTAEERALVAWIGAQPSPPTLLTTAPQVLAAWSERGRFHWMACDDAPEQIETLLRRLPVDGVVVYPRERACPAVAWLAGDASDAGVAEPPVPRAAALFAAGGLEVWPNPYRR